MCVFSVRGIDEFEDREEGRKVRTVGAGDGRGGWFDIMFN